MHGCSRASTKSTATSAVSKVLEAIPGRGFSYVELKSSGDREKSGRVSNVVEGYSQVSIPFGRLGKGFKPLAPRPS